MRAALAPLLLRLAGGRGRTRCGRGRRRHVAVEARLLLVVERAVEGRERGLDRVEGRERGVNPLLHRLEPRRRRRGHVLRAVGGKTLGRLLGALAQRRERGALLLVSADALPDGVERPVLELGALLAAAAHELLDHGAERAAAGAAPILVAGAALVIAGARAVVGLAGAIFAAILAEIPGVAAAPPLVEAACAPAIATLARTIGAAILHAVLPAILALILRLTLVLALSLILGLTLILPAALPAVLSLTLG